MKELIIYEYQAKSIENTLRLVANFMKAHSKDTCLKRDVMQDWERIQNVLKGQPEKHTNRF